MKRILLAAAATLLVAAAAHAQPTIDVEELRCLPSGANALVKATSANEPAGATARLYFQWREHGEDYWIDMEPAGGGRYWTAFPKPERRNTEVEYNAALVDGTGQVVARSTTRTVKVNGNCPVRLSESQAGVAGNLTVGETAAVQQGKGVLGFLCDGIVTRVNHVGIRRSDEICRACVVAWWGMIPAGLATIIAPPFIPDSEPSPSRP